MASWSICIWGLLTWTDLRVARTQFESSFWLTHSWARVLFQVPHENDFSIEYLNIEAWESLGQIHLPFRPSSSAQLWRPFTSLPVPVLWLQLINYNIIRFLTVSWRVKVDIIIYLQLVPSCTLFLKQFKLCCLGTKRAPVVKIQFLLLLTF